MKTALILALLAALLVPGRLAFAQAVSQEAEGFLRELRFERPPTRLEKQELLVALRRRGIVTLTDLRPFLVRSERVRHNALIAIDYFDRIDDETLGLIEQLAQEAGASSEASAATAVRMVLQRRPLRRAAAFGLAIAPGAHFRSLRELMTWLAARPRRAFAASPEGHELTRACLARLASLFEHGAYSGEWPISFSLLMTRPPFDDPAHAGEVGRAFLSALENTGRLTGLRELGLISAFAAVAPVAEESPQLVEAGLGHIVTSGQEPLVKLVLWRMSCDGFDRTPSGEIVVATALRKSPELAAFLGRLRAARGDDADAQRAVTQQVTRALDELTPPTADLAAAGTVLR
jgi:hypothetical protein